MPNPFDPGSFRPDAAFSAAAGQFAELLKTLGVPSGARPMDWAALTAPLAGQFEQWLRGAQSAGPWFSSSAPWSGSSAANTSSFGPLPLGPAAPGAHDAQHTFELMSQLGKLQAQLAVHWSEIAQTAARSFVARAAAAGGAPVSPDQALKLYELWVSCAEEAYAATVHKEEFAHLQAQLANTSAALLVEQRRHAETLVRAFGLPTRSEVDALYDQLKELRRMIAALAPAPVPPPPAAGATSARTRKVHPPRKRTRRKPAR